VLALAVALKKENPDRTAAQVTRILAAQSRWAPTERTIQRHFELLELSSPAPAAPQAARAALTGTPVPADRQRRRQRPQRPQPAGIQHQARPGVRPRPEHVSQ
jgi:hypothetical protein